MSVHKYLKTPGFTPSHCQYRDAVNCKVLVYNMLKVFMLYQGLSDYSTVIIQKMEKSRGSCLFWSEWWQFLYCYRLISFLHLLFCSDTLCCGYNEGFCSEKATLSPNYWIKRQDLFLLLLTHDQFYQLALLFSEKVENWNVMLSWTNRLISFSLLSIGFIC